MLHLLWTTLAFAIYRKVLELALASLTVPSGCTAYMHLDALVARQYTGRHVEVDHDSAVKLATNVTTWFRSRGCMVGACKTVEGGGPNAQRRVYFVWAFRRATLEALLADARAGYESRGTVEVRMSGRYDWAVRTQPARPRSTIASPAPIDAMLDDAREFERSRTRYASLGVPFRRGYLLEGPPGTGKSSCALCVATELGRSLCYLSLTGKGADDQWLDHMLSTTPGGALVLLDDYDRVDLGDQHGVTVSGMLNAMDGVVAQASGRIIMIAVNDISVVTPALLRPGRVDRTFRFTHADRSDAVAMFERIHGATHAEAFGARIPCPCTPSAIVTHLARYECPVEAIERAHEIAA